MVHCSGFFSGRQRRNLVPWRKRPPEKWSYWNSPTNFGLSGNHPVSRASRVQRLGPPGALPEKPSPPMKGLRIDFSFLRSSRVKLELKPMWSSSPFLLYSPSSREPTSSVGLSVACSELDSLASPAEAFAPLAQRKPPTTQSAVRMRLILTMPVLSPDMYSQSRRLATTPSQPLAAPSRIHFSAVAKSELAGESMIRWSALSKVVVESVFLLRLLLGSAPKLMLTAANSWSAMRRAESGVAVSDLPLASIRRSNTMYVAGVSWESRWIRLAAGWMRCKSASKSRPGPLRITISPSSTNRRAGKA